MKPEALEISVILNFVVIHQINSKYQKVRKFRLTVYFKGNENIKSADREK